MTDTSIRVLVVDDHSIVRQGIKQVLESEPGILVVGEADSGDTAVREATRTQPDVVLLDITMPDESGVHTIPKVLAASPATRVVMLTVHDNTEYVIRSVRAGAHGYVRKDTTPASLRAAVRAVYDGGEYFGPEIASHLTAALRGNIPDTVRAELAEQRLASLTSREREVLACIVRGNQNKETASTLGISVRTVEAHRESIMRKLGVRSVAELTRIALTHQGDSARESLT